MRGFLKVFITTLGVSVGLFCLFYADLIVDLNNILRSAHAKGELADMSNNTTLSKYRVEQRKPRTVAATNQNCASMKFLVYVCRDKQMCGGWGDRQKGMISVYLLAILTNRTFMIMYDSPCELTKFLVPKEYNWTLCSQYIRTIPQSKIQNIGFFNSLKKNISNMNLQNTFTSKVVFIHTNQIWIKEIMLHRKAAEMIPWAVGKTIPEVNRLVLSQLFQPTELLANGMKTFLGNISRNRKLICSHLRIGKNPTMPQDNKRPPVDVIAIFKFLKQFDLPSRYAIYVASDSEKVRGSVKGNFTSGYTVDLPIIHVDRFFKEQRSVACDGLYTVLLEQQILSSCDLIILTRSNLGAMAAYMSPKEQEVFIYFLPKRTILPVSVNGIQQYYKFL